MTNASANTNAHGNAHDDFLSHVKTLREAEKSASAKLEGFRSQSSSIESGAKEKAVEIAARAGEKAVEAKNELLAKGRQETDAEIEGIIKDAKHSAEKIRAKRLSDKDVESLSSQIL